MNTIRNIESATLMSIGALCAAAVLTIAAHSAHAFTASQAGASNVPTVTITAKRMTAAEKSALRAEIDNGHTTL